MNQNTLEKKVCRPRDDMLVDMGCQLAWQEKKESPGSSVARKETRRDTLVRYKTSKQINKNMERGGNVTVLEGSSTLFFLDELTEFRST